MLRKLLIYPFFSLVLLSLAVNLGFFLLSEELLVFFSSLLFIAFLLALLRKTVRSYFFQRAYQVLLVFLSLFHSCVLLLLKLRLYSAILLCGLRMLPFNILLRNAALNFALFLVLFTKAQKSAFSHVLISHRLAARSTTPFPFLSELYTMSHG